MDDGREYIYVVMRVPTNENKLHRVIGVYTTAKGAAEAILDCSSIQNYYIAIHELREE